MVDSPVASASKPITSNGDASEIPTDIILPPPAIREIADKTAGFVAKQKDPSSFENKVRNREKADSRFSFLQPGDVYHAYYQYKIKEIKSGAAVTAGGLSTPSAGAAAAQVPEDPDELDRPKGDPPAPWEFKGEMPTINAVDLDILRLTALFTARSGRKFSNDLAAKERTNYQFDFLRPSHSLFGYFNRLVQQYEAVISPTSVALENLTRRSGRLASGLTEKEKRAEGRREVMKDVRKRVEWERWEQDKRKKKEDAQEKERKAFEEIEWQDFQVVSTVEFTDADDLIELPAPLKLADVENMSLAEKRMAALLMEGKEMPAEEEPEVQAIEQPMDEAASAERRKQVEIKIAHESGPMKIRKDYVPKSKSAKGNTTTCTICGQEVPVDEFQEHVRIELLDPAWKEKQAQTERNRTAANMLTEGADVSASLRKLAAKRGDIFTTTAAADKRKAEEAEERKKQKERERAVWDGHTNSSDAVTARFAAGASFDAQIDALHRAKGLAGSELQGQVGPGLSAPAPEPVQFTGVSMSAAPQPASNLPSFGPPINFASGMAPPGMAPPQPLPPISLAPGGYSYGQIRPAVDPAVGQPDAKRRKMPGQVYPEAEWLRLHPEPITVSVQLPTLPDKPEWHCDGSVLQLSDIPLTLLAGTLRDRIQEKIGMPTGRQKLSLGARILQANITLAALNLDSYDVLTLALKETKKR
ncbi:uncharacterized protein L969DRAFT_85848 [Mixia osmundae IAM 14324]|uniref:SURP motif domain-containing protein n=1 Tax=Mixia osmundae (strain CBS 9802 / IAM 14324 / JCM 22182 / KY 12970) TaxID=764103 RepID=G7E5V3_MIXOS|nr:uncharacterized protein L969DRAFT_85848 [Mixia osmundae IAM 14324]KEI40635.1 hypothetical protein L969DRAFT_85848 [Mixia osmundae IAM 14324]GAA98213.1 hypothetical protein E5Q_04896 [Mixia osmundae IAM 14324]